ncbi:MAG TPA: choice-of-anchor tandem repeat GloVer-containing protein [Candidatus Limnocylindrales bacterium]|jgi:uncharacterized repeat protein (TIGR03803 family)|nr:choice-of-anchor tandem repeat GloVer-containing protein [Candidatus Limnocylindrales bacterium]
MAGLSLSLVDGVIGQTFTTLYHFTTTNTNLGGIVTNTDGAQPFAGLLLAGSLLYGPAQNGGSAGKGTLFAIATNGSVFTNLHSFSPTAGPANANPDGAIPQAKLILDANTLYGTAIGGGSSGVGTIFAVNTDATAFRTLHSFTGPLANSDGAYPHAGLILSGSTLYGTTTEGGSVGNGTIFKVNTDGNDFAALYTFTARNLNASRFYTNSDGAHPWAGLVLVGNTLYGTAAEGGPSGGGTVFALNSDGTGFRTLHSFIASTNSSNLEGAYPYGGLIVAGNLLFGTTEFGGSTGNGTVFAVNIDGTGFTNLHSFTGLDGARPTAELVMNGNSLYGTTSFGGSLGKGTLFTMNTDGAGFKTLHTFTGDTDGAFPFGGLVLFNNTLYGTASAGGSSDLGTVYGLLLGSSTAAPELTILRAGQNVVLMWPADAVGFILQSTTDLAPPAIWTTVNATPLVVNGQNAVTNAASDSQQFFRLIQ